MRRLWHRGALLLFVAAAYAQNPSTAEDERYKYPPNDAEQKQMLEQIKASAASYARELPDFVCSKVTRHSLDTTGTGRNWRQTDTIDENLSFLGHKDSYQLVMVNGKKATGSEHETGAESFGEFGDLLSWIFDPGAQATFSWNTWGVLNNHRVAVFNYNVAQKQARVALGKSHTALAYLGAVFAEVNTFKILQVTMLAQGPGKTPEKISRTVDFDFAQLGDKQFLVPLKMDLNHAEGKTLRWDEVEFKKFHKPDAGPADLFEKRKQ